MLHILVHKLYYQRLRKRRRILYNHTSSCMFQVSHFFLTFFHVWNREQIPRGLIPDDSRPNAERLFEWRVRQVVFVLRGNGSVGTEFPTCYLVLLQFFLITLWCQWVRCKGWRNAKEWMKEMTGLPQDFASMNKSSAGYLVDRGSLSYSRTWGDAVQGWWKPLTSKNHQNISESYFSTKMHHIYTHFLIASFNLKCIAYHEVLNLRHIWELINVWNW